VTFSELTPVGHRDNRDKSGESVRVITQQCLSPCSNEGNSSATAFRVQPVPHPA
jgi:hypothetical protein